MRRLAGFAAIYTASQVTASWVAWWPITAVAVIVCAWVLVGCAGLSHWAVHRTLASRRRVNTAIGVVCGAVAGVPFGVYRGYHRAHHAHFLTVRDPEFPPAAIGSRAHYMLLPAAGLWSAGQLMWWTARTVVGRPPPFVRPRRDYRLAIATGLLQIMWVNAAVVWLPWSWWLLPWAVAVCVLEPLLLLPEHHGADPADRHDPLTTTATITSNAVVRWVYAGNNFHAAHHGAPTVRPSQIAAYQHTISPLQPHTWAATGYLAWHLHLWRALPWKAQSNNDVTFGRQHRSCTP